ncbi:SDH family Clp fold serine proteinase [Comamonas sp. 4034]|uniref:SDH family Clp fold serine proteinase n=1 Tax=Comamonas sp. 4034 TaxID=3156455 RepID=UPI003D22885C
MAEELSFPRGTKKPAQSPLFWVQNKDRYLRQLLISDIQKVTGRDLLVYFSDCDRSDAQIEQTDDIYLSELLRASTSKFIDLLIETNGGFTDATEKVCSVITSSGKDIRVIVPRRAKSNGTVITFCGGSIVMGLDSELGPIDPHLNGTPCDFIIRLQGIDALVLMAAQAAVLQTKKLASQLLKANMLSAMNEGDIDALVQRLASRDQYYSHGSVIDASEAIRLGLNIELLQPEDALWQQLWLLRTMYAYDCMMRGYSKVFESVNVSSPIVMPRVNTAA